MSNETPAPVSRTFLGLERSSPAGGFQGNRDLIAFFL
jgi:hypothetical protein